MRGILVWALLLSVAHAQGQFEGASDVGSVTPPGTASFNAATNTYTLTAAGANTWYHVDNFHYLWKKSSGDMALSAEVSFPPVTYDHNPDPHRKGILMFRQSLDAGGVYVGVAQHGSGLMALQFRRQRGANSEDVELNIEGPKTVQIVKQGDVFTMYVSMKGEPFHPVGASVELHLEEPFYVGLGAVSHDVSTTDKVEFTRVSLQRTAPAPTTARQVVYSTLQTISINDQFRRAMVIRTMPARIDSPNWAPDGKSIYVHEGGRIQRIPYLNPPAGGPPQPIDTGKLVGCSGNYGLSPDGKWVAVSCSEVSGAPHEVFLLPATGGGTPRKVTNTTASSYFHAWAPDSQSLAFTQGAASKADIFTVPIDGGAERRLTSDTVNDGPDYTPDGKFIYFDSSRSGRLQIWRMKPDGSAAEQITDDDGNNHSPHVSPDGKSVAFLSQQAPENGEIVPTVLKVISSSDGMIHDVVHFQGNRGSFQMYGWGDATHLAFVSYQKLREGDQDAVGNAHGARAGKEAARNAAIDRPAITGVSHISVYTADAMKAERFYVHDLGAVAASDPEVASGHRYYFAPTQFVEVLPLPAGPPSINRLDHVAFTTTDAAQLRKHLAAQKIKVPKDVEHAKDGSLWFKVTDPEGNQIEFVQPPASLPDIPGNPLSSHIIHVGFIVHNRELEDGFFQKVLGFRPYWFGGMKEDTPTWISQQVPDGTDWLEYMIVGTPDGRGIPPTMSAATLGVLNHFSLGVANAEDAYTLLWKGNRLDDQSNTPKIGRDAKWQLNLIDPDGTRAEVMEFHAIGTPCCSPFTATDPQK
jgi:Tol biopolymer transport system component/catechol 2,3-dioxygenase-like lactoylglutathione lyase family enzyme